MAEEPVYFENFDLDNMITPVKVEMFISELQKSNYDTNETDFLESGLTNGFDIGYNGPQTRRCTAENIPFRDGVGNSAVLWNKLMKEVKLKRVAGPFESIPFENYIQSPIGLVPKADNQTRLIFHLSYDCKRDGLQSVNHYTPRDICTVHYKDIDYAVRAYLRVLEECEDATKDDKIDRPGLWKKW